MKNTGTGICRGVAGYLRSVITMSGGHLTSVAVPRLVWSVSD